MSLLVRLSAVRGIGFMIGGLGAVLALLFTFLLYPAVGGAYHAVLDPDLHGPLGFGIWKFHTFSYYPNPALASARGPLYPAFVAALLAATDGWWPQSVQLAQCALFGLMCVLAFWTARALWGAPLAVLAAGACALDPFLIWYTSRIWVEPLMMFLFTALVASIVRVRQRPTVGAALLVGAILGSSVLAKSIYLPFLVLTPLLLILPVGRPLRPALAALILATGLAIILPWTLRNGRVTGIYAPEVGNTGFTLHQGNDFIEDFAKAPFSVVGLYKYSIARMRGEEDFEFPPGMSVAQQRLEVDATRRRNAVAKLVGSPAFALKKLAYGAVLFWTFGDTPGKSLAIALLQLPVLVLFGTFLVRRRRELVGGTAGLCAALVILFYLAHLPTIALARYSAVLVPAMLIIAVGVFAVPEQRGSAGRPSVPMRS